MNSTFSLRRVATLVAILGGFLMATAGSAAGLLRPADGSTPPLSIKQHHVQVTIEDGYAITEVEQLFHNPNDRDLTAWYSFPVPEHGSVAEFTVWIDGKPVVGEVLEKQRAREIHETEKAAGRETGLAEKDEYRSFDVQVHPVRAGQDTRIRLVYLQPASMDSGIGRYVYPLEDGGVDEQRMAFWTAQDTVEEQFSFQLQLRSGYPVDAVRVPGQAGALVTQQAAGLWAVQLDSGNAPLIAASEDNVSESATAPQQPLHSGPAARLDQDIVVYWRHPADLPGSVDAVAYKPVGAQRGSFMLTVTPGADLQPISDGSDWIFVLDTSGSMSGKLASLADGVGQALGRMRPNDRFRIITFGDRASDISKAYVPATTEQVQAYIQKVQNLQAGGGTNLHAGLKRALSTLDADRPTGIVLVTDGVANVGVTEQKAFLKLLQQHDVRLFTAIMGNSANRPLLEAMTEASNGFAVSVSNSDEIVGQILQASAKLTHQAMNEVRIEIDGVRTANLTPSRIGSLYRGEQLVVMGHYFGDGPATLRVHGKVNGRDVSYSTRIDFPEAAGRNPELERLWAYARVQELAQEIRNFGESRELREAIIDLGVEYSLVTDHTSMLVLRDEIFSQYGIDRRNASRRQLEKLAQAQRAQQAPVSNRADSAQPMFGNSPRPSTGTGGGALSPWWALLAILGRLLSGSPRSRTG